MTVQGTVETLATTRTLSPIVELRRTVSACLLWEDTFYESGVSVAERIKNAVAKCEPEAVAALAIDARERMKLRKVPLLLARELVRRGYNVAPLLERIIQRPDELTEFLALYWADRGTGPKKIPASVKRGLAAAFRKFSAYSLAKYNRDEPIKLRDVLFLVHAKPKSDEQAATWKQLVEKTLPAPDTWEVALSTGEEPREAWTRLLTDKKLGALALLRNLRNMQTAKVDDDVIRAALRECNPERVLPFRFVSAVQYAPRFQPELEALMFKCLAERPKLKGKTVLLLDGSGSMFNAKVSAKSEIDRFDAAAALAMLVREVCEQVEVVLFSTTAMQVPDARGFALRNELVRRAQRNTTNTETGKKLCDGLGYDRLVILTDEQSHQKISAPKGKGYIVNVATYQNGIGYGEWTHIDGWSEAILDFIEVSEHE